MKPTIFLTLALTLLNAVLSFNALNADDAVLTLAKDGRATAKIVLANSPTRVEQNAAEELKSHLNTIVTGSAWSVIRESDVDKNATLILVGDSKLARELFPAVDFDAIPYDGIVIKTSGNKLLLAGHKMRGNLYAVYTFLQDTLGCRWWTSTESAIPRKSDIVVPALDVEYAPQLIHRETNYRDIDGPFAARTKLNGANSDSSEWGGRVQFILGCHSFEPLLPPEKYFKDHPEWYSEINGKRSGERTQLCLTNDEMRAELTKNVLEILRKRANPNARFISISQNDWDDWCTCEKCKALDDLEESHAGTVVHFINKVAEDIEKEFPDVWVETLAYQYTRKPPKFVKPRDNVIIRLCPIECSFSQTLRDGKQNRSFHEDIEGWSKIAHQLFIWDYVTNFGMFLIPHPNYDVLADNIRFFVDNGSIGLFEQGDWYTTVGDFIRMRTYVMSHLMWDPSLDEHALRADFINGYYGEAAAPIIQEYLNLLVKRVEDTGIYLKAFHQDTTEWLDYDTLCEASALMERAIEVTVEALGADAPEVVRIRREKMAIDMVWLQEYYALKRYAALNNKPFMGPEDPLEGVKAWFALSDLHENSGWSEFTWEITNFKENMFRRYAPMPAPPSVCDGLPEGSWIDYQNFEISSHKHDDWTKWSFIEDAAASNGFAIRIYGGTDSWSLGHHFDPTVFQLRSASGNDDQPAKYRIYASVRCEGTATDGKAITLAIHDPTGQGSGGKNIDVSEIKGKEYTLVDLGEFKLTPDSYIFGGPPNRPGEVEYIYIDRFILIRE